MSRRWLVLISTERSLGINSPGEEDEGEECTQENEVWGIGRQRRIMIYRESKIGNTKEEDRKRGW